MCIFCTASGAAPGTSAGWSVTALAPVAPAGAPPVPERGVGYAEFTGDPTLDSLLWGTRWTSPVLTYAFPETRAEWGANFPAGAVGEVLAPTDGLRAAVELILAGRTEVEGAPATRFGSVASFTLLEFAPGTTETATLRFGLGQAMTSLGFAGPPGVQATNPIVAVSGGVPEIREGDTWLNALGRGDPTHWDLGTLLPGSEEWLTLTHEIGHALGLPHPFTGPTLAGTPAVVMPNARNGNEFTVMAYNGPPGPGSDQGYPAQGSSPQSWMAYDIRALQHLYGANYGWQAGDTTYRWDPATGEMFIDGVGQGAPASNRILLAIWDGGGRDTYDLSNYGGRQSVDLRPGEGSVFSQAQRANLGDGVRAQTNVRNAFLHEGDPRALIENAITGERADLLQGNAAANHLRANGGRDTLIGEAGADTLDGGAGADSMGGGRGDDTYLVDHAGDSIAEAPGGGRDEVIASLAYRLGAELEHLRLLGGAMTGIGNGLSNRIIGNEGGNRLFGLGGDDMLLGGGGADRLAGGDGRDQLDGEAGDDRLAGEAGNDQLLGRDGNDWLDGGAGEDELSGHAGDDTLLGGDGTDILAGGVGQDSLAGGPGADFYIVEDAGDWLREAADGGHDSVWSAVDFQLGANFEQLSLIGGARSGTGNGLANIINGSAGDDLLRGLAGDDQLSGNSGNDTLQGDDGDDRLRGGAGDDVLIGGSGHDDAEGGEGDDLLQGGAGQDTLYGDAGADTASGGADSDELLGGEGGDSLAGGPGSDGLSGEDGNDTLMGGGAPAEPGALDPDDDVLIGGTGSDLFVFLAGDGGEDEVTDFSLAQDRLLFEGLFASIAAALAAASQTAEGARFDFGADGGGVLLSGIAAASLTADHILIG